MKHAKSWCLAALAAAVTLGPMVLPAAAALTVVDTRGLVFSRNAREDASFTTNSVAWVDLYVTSVTIPNTIEYGVIRARYTAESLCVGVAGICRVRVLVNGVELFPISGANFAFDSTDNGVESANSMEGHAVERSSYKLPPGNYTVKLQVSVDNAAVDFTVDDWHFAIEVLQAL